MLTLHNHTTLLIDLHFTLHRRLHPHPTLPHTATPPPQYHSHPFPPTAFAASLPNLTDTTPQQFARALDQACLARIRAMTRYTRYAFDEPVDYEVERVFVFRGLEDARLDVRGLGAEELRVQVGFLGGGGGGTGGRGWVRVVMGVEIGDGTEIGGGTEIGAGEGEGVVAA